MKRSTRIGIMGTVALAAALSLGRVVYSPSFYLAQKFERLRDRYVQKVVRGEGVLPEYVAGVRYIDSAKAEGYRKNHGLDNLAAMHTFGGEASQIGKREIKSEIAVLPYSFEGDFIETEEDFESTLDHEMTHANHFYNGFPSISGFDGNGIEDDVLEVVNELSALRIEIAGFSKRKVSRKHAVPTFTRYMVHYCELWNPEVQAHLEPGVPEALQDLFFEDWMLKSNAYRNDGDKRFVLDPENGEWLRLPESVK